MACLPPPEVLERDESTASELWMSFMATTSSSSTVGLSAAALEASVFDDYMFAGLAVGAVTSVKTALTTESLVKYKETDETGDSCAHGGKHEFRAQTVARPLECDSCDRLLPLGACFFGCLRCAQDVCDNCHSRLKARGLAPDATEVVGSAAGSHADANEDFGRTWSSEGSEAIEDVVVDSRPCGNSWSTAGSVQDLQEVDEAAKSIAKLPSNVTAGGSKECSRCGTSYKGFGDVCAPCRKTGHLGTAQECRMCNNYFQGFGTTCSDCSVSSGPALPRPLVC